jgi:hypothetical protein
MNKIETMRGTGVTGGMLLAAGWVAMTVVACTSTPAAVPAQPGTPMATSGTLAQPSAAGTAAQLAAAGGSARAGSVAVASPNAGAGGAGASNGGTAGSGGGLPCAVSKALIANCQQCHGAQQIGGAPMPLVTYSDVKKMAVTKPSMTVQQLALTRMNDVAMPMPPGGKISAADKKTLTDWLSAGATPAPASEPSCDTSGVTAPQPDYKTGLVPKPGETCYDLPTHGGQTPGDKTVYSVKPGEHYEQFYFKTPWPAGVVATRFGAKFDNIKVLHHWLLFTSAKPVSMDGTHETTAGTQLGDTAQLIGGWAVGGKNVEFPDDMGFELPSAELLNAQWHFYNQGTANENDASMVQVCTVPAAMRKNIASMTFLGTEDFNSFLGMPPHETSQFGGTCTNESTGPITIWAFWPHMHKLGRRMTSVITRVDGKTEMAFDSAFDFNLQIHYPLSPMLVLQPGDSITSTCTFENNTDFAVAFGPSTEQEMCYQFAFTYPARAIDNGVISLIGATNTCW